MTGMARGASSAPVIGLPRLGVSASAAPAATASAVPARISLRIDMLDLPIGADGPARDRIEVLAREAEDRRRPRSLAARGDEVGAQRLEIAALVPGAALQNRRPAVPAPGHAEARERLGQYWVLERRLRPA